MKSIVVAITKEKLEQLTRRATEYNISPEELVRLKLEELLNLPEEEFKRRIELSLWIDKTIEKYHDTFQRLSDS